MAKKLFLWILILAMLAVPAFAKDLVPIGHTTGIKIFCDGVMVVRCVPINTENGQNAPAKDAGIQPGDVVMRVGEIPVRTNEELQAAIKSGDPVTLTVRRAGKEEMVSVTPICDETGAYRIGLWVRDSMAGIGTVTYYDPETGAFGALGHGICDTDTNGLIPMKSGSVMQSQVREVRKGEVGTPGELVGDYDLKHDCGVLNSNTEHGIFGRFTENVDFLSGVAIPVAEKNEIKVGPATILSNIQGNDVRKYQIEITQVFAKNEENGKSMMIKITDPELLAQTGGIVQGMSGSPIIQDGKLVGAVTHVLVNDPTRGYGIFIENMLDAAG
ncbi:MAG: SpoIVB peptidase [Oscillospiraceae bacterium]|nr:SpoIVB peptidase [Oscillospiraceae bacterium]